MSTITLKLQKTDSDFLEVCASKIYDVNGNDFYHIPFWFEKIGNGLFVQYGFDDLPKELINRIKEDRGCKEEVNESKPTEQFIWTDELVAECYEFIRNDNAGILTPVGVQKNIEQFKQSKSKKEEPQWEILAYINPNVFTDVLGGNIVDAKGSGANYAILKNFPIHSVKRLSDGEVFSVGDKIFDCAYKPQIIKGFKISNINQQMMIDCECDGVCEVGLCYAHKNDEGKAEYDAMQILYDKGYILKHPEKGVSFQTKLKSKAPKEEQVPIKVEKLYFECHGLKTWDYVLEMSKPIPDDKRESIKEAIERELNGVSSPKVEIGDLESFNRGYSMGYKDTNKYNDEKYTESELLQARRDAFDAAREVVGYSDAFKNSPVTVERKYKDNEDYINSLK